MPDTPEELLGFPWNVIDVLHQSFAEFMPEYELVDRPVRPNDPAQTLGFNVVDWNPVPKSENIGDQLEPVLNRYEYRIQLFVKAGDEVTGRRTAGVGAKSVKAILYRDPGLAVRLAALNETVLGTRESFRRFGMRRQRFLNNEVRGSFLYVVATDFFIETESSKL